MAPSEKETEGEKQIREAETERTWFQKRVREYKEETARLNAADSTARLLVNPHLCRSYSSMHSSLKEILQKLHVHGMIV